MDALISAIFALSDAERTVACIEPRCCGKKVSGFRGRYEARKPAGFRPAFSDQKRSFPRRIGKVVFLLAFFWGGVGFNNSFLFVKHASAAEERPNVIIVITDDQGYGDLSCHGNPILKTPHIDRLWAEGVRLSDFHVSPVCTPTRGQLMTGLDALRNGARSVPAATNMIWRNIPTTAEYFRQAGYRTGHFGKWHLGDHWPDRPMDRGFEKAIWFGGWGVASDLEFDNDCMNIRVFDGDRMIQTQLYCTDLFFAEAIQWMEECRAAGEAFLCYIATNAPHGPLWAKEEDEARYRDRVPPAVASFFGMIANIDDNIGKLEKWLSDRGLRDQTILIFTTDNGGTAGRKIFNAGLREGKGTLYEGGHRVPCFIRWPAGGITGGREVGFPTQVQDILPTLLELCRIPKREGIRFDGQSLAGVLRGKPAPSELTDRFLVVQYGGRIRATKYESCVIQGPWRLVYGKELYNVALDPGQNVDISPRHPEVVERLRSYYDQWWAGIEDRVFEYQPIPVGTQHENPVILSPNYWMGVDVDNHHRVSSAEGGERGGKFLIDVTRAGKYRIEFRRWPFHTRCSIGSPGPEQTVSGRSLLEVIKKRATIPAHAAVLEVGERQFRAETTPDALGVEFVIELPAGVTTLQGWFQGAAGQDLCGAFYVAVEFFEN